MWIFTRCLQRSFITSEDGKVQQTGILATLFTFVDFESFRFGSQNILHRISITQIEYVYVLGGWLAVPAPLPCENWYNFKYGWMCCQNNAPCTAYFDCWQRNYSTHSYLYYQEQLCRVYESLVSFVNWYLWSDNHGSLASKCDWISNRMRNVAVTSPACISPCLAMSNSGAPFINRDK